jgi:acyl carrier protein
MTTRQSDAEILATIATALQSVLGEDFLLGVEVTRETTFNEDLALESIEFVALAEELQAHYGPGVDLTAFVAELDIDELMGMSVGQLVDYLAKAPAVSR